MTRHSKPIAVVMPCLNEAERVRQAIESLLADPQSDDCIFLLMDGGSTDTTRAIVADVFGERVEIINNPHRLQAHAMNLGALEARRRGAHRLLRADLHAIYPERFVSTLSLTMDETGADSVVIPMRTIGGNALQNAAALIFGSWLGNGGSPHRTGEISGWVDHGHHALFDLRAFLAAGGYDPNFAANEDAEFDMRLNAGGGRVYLENKAVINYIPRETLPATVRQFFRNGRFRIWTAVKHRQMLGKRQILPLLVVPVLGLALLASFLKPVVLVIPIAYLTVLLCLSWAGRDAAPVPATPRLILNAVLVAAASHFGFSAGGLYGVYELFVRNRAQGDALRTREHPPLDI